MKLIFIQTLVSAVVSKLDQENSSKIRGVNLGGWLVLEPWITPSLFEAYKGEKDAPMDEYNLSMKLGLKAKETLEDHRKSWVTKNDFIKLREAGINHVRIPVGYWAVDIQPDEPWVEGSFDYLEQGVRWANETGFKVMIDIHGAPGSQNGFDNSGRYGPVNFLEPKNINRLVKVLANLTSRFTQPEYKHVVKQIQLVNEPHGHLQDIKGIENYYNRGINTVRSIDKEITIAIHNAFYPLTHWEYLKENTSLTSRDNLMYDIHRYQVFNESFYQINKTAHLKHSCAFLEEFRRATKFYPVVVGEWSLATTDCTKYLNGFGIGTRYEGTLNSTSPQPNKENPVGSCSKHDNLSDFSTDHKAFLNQFFRQQVGVFESAGAGWFFWNFKAENSPEWNFLLGVEQGWINLHSPISHQC